MTTGTGIGERSSGMITGAIPTAFLAGICLRQEAAVCGSTTVRPVSSLHRQAAVKRSDLLTDMAAE